MCCNTHIVGNLMYHLPKLFHTQLYYKDSGAMSTWQILVSVLLLIHPAQSQHITSTCEIPSVEAGENATLTIRFGQDLRKEGIRDFSVDHIGHSSTASQTRLLSCEFTKGNVTCKETPCCTWESHVTDVFRVYIHNVSQELEGRFFGFVIPASIEYQKSCNFSLKAFSCPTDSINATNSHTTCSNPTVTLCQTCTVTCNHGYHFKENHNSVTYTCVGKKKWFPENPLRSCEAYTCPTDFINASNSHMKCSKQPVTIGETCIVTCNPDHYFKENQTSVTYRCVGKNKWSPEIPVTSCKEQPKVQEAHGLYFLLLLLIVIPIAMVIFIFFIRQARKREQIQKGVEEDLLAELKKLKDSTQGEGHPLLTSVENYWLLCIEKWYPQFHSRSYFLPPFHFNQEKFTMKNIAGQDVYVPEGTQSNPRVHFDRALQRVLSGMRALADNGQEKEVMFVVSQLQFGNYLGEPTFAPAVALLQRPSTLPEDLRKQHFDKGDFDVLIIHSQHGLFTLQISSVGGDFSQQTMTDQEEDALIRKAEEVTKQLNKAEVILKHLTSDLMIEINITKCLVMPNITSGQLKRAIERSHSTGQFLCECLGAKNVDDAVKLCLLKDQLSDNQTPSGIYSSLQALIEWWQHIVNASKSKSLLTSSLYKQLVARFCGPAITVDVHCVTAPRLNIRTLGEAVSETGERVARLVLFPQQVDILNQSPPRAFVSGPPGTGKTIVLIMQGLTWLQRGYDIHVVSTCDESRAVTVAIEYKLLLLETAKTSTARSRLHRHQFDLRKDGEVKAAVSCLKCQSEGRQLCVITDEVVSEDYRFTFTELCDQLIKEVPGVYIWGASVYHDVRPLCLEEVKLTTPLRSPPVVVREVMEAEEIKNKQVDDYTISDVPVLTDGPPVMRIEHHDGQSDHTGYWPRDCVECGHEVARVLTKLNVGRTGNSNGPPPLQYRDVLVVCLGDVTDDRVDNGQVTTASGLVRGLRDRQVPVRVEDEGDEAAIRDMALGVSDLVTVANWDNVFGLERKVVVVEFSINVFVRLHAMSRCTSQLVILSTQN